jgi:hypothetical protein
MNFYYRDYNQKIKNKLSIRYRDSNVRFCSPLTCIYTIRISVDCLAAVNGEYAKIFINIYSYTSWLLYLGLARTK